MLRKNKKIEENEEDYHKDELIRLQKWLNRRYPEVIDEYDEENYSIIHT